MWIYRLLSVCLCACTVRDFSAEDKASGVKFCTAVHRRPRQGISHFCELCSPRSPKSDESASAPPPPRRSQRLPFGSRTHDRAACRRRIGMCGYTSVTRRRAVSADAGTRHFRCYKTPADPAARADPSAVLPWLVRSLVEAASVRSYCGIVSSCRRAIHAARSVVRKRCREALQITVACVSIIRAMFAYPWVLIPPSELRLSLSRAGPIPSSHVSPRRRTYLFFFCICTCFRSRLVFSSFNLHSTTSSG